MTTPKATESVAGHNPSPGVQYLTVSASEAGQRLDNFLQTKLKGAPKTLIYKIIRKGELRVNKGRKQAAYRLEAEDVVRVPPLKLDDPKDIKIPAPLIKKLEARILHEDDELIVINKPAGMAVHSGTGIDIGVIDILQAARPELEYLQLAHRLDRDTSGCLMLAKRRHYLRRLQDLLRDGEVDKHYQCLVVGHWNDAIRLKSNLSKGAIVGGERHVVSNPDGKFARTRFKPLEHRQIGKGQALTLLEARLDTGRTHQIRVQASEYGYPLVGDDKYGNREMNKLCKQHGLKRMFLHAQRLGFVCPETGERMEFAANLEPELREFLDGLGGAVRSARYVRSQEFKAKHKEQNQGKGRK